MYDSRHLHSVSFIDINDSFVGFFLIFTRGLNTALDLVPLSWWDWLKIGGAVVIHTIVIELMKVIMRYKLKRDTQMYVFFLILLYFFFDALADTRQA